MNKQTSLPRVADELEAMDAEAKKAAEKAKANLRIWNALGKTDPAHTKQFSRAGGFKGTAIKPIWITQRLTELFGPVGKGWGFDKPEFQLVTTGTDTLVYCTVTAWYIDGSEPPDEILSDRRLVYGVGGDKVVAQRQSGPFCDDEAFKKAFTDALGNAFKFVGVGADVHMGLFEDSKYLAEVTAEFHPKPDPIADRPANDRNGKDAPFPQGPAKNKTELKTLGRAFWRDVEACGDSDELECCLADKTNRLIVKQLIEALPTWWTGGQRDGEPFEGLEAVIARKRKEFEQENV